MIRNLGAAFLAVSLTVALSPSAAFALDDNADLVCLEEGTRQYSSHTPGVYETVNIGYCERWGWTPPKGSSGGGGGTDDAGGIGPGAGGSYEPPAVPKVDCDQVKGQLKQAEELYDAYMAEYVRARDAANNTFINVENQGTNTDQLYQAYLQAQADLKSWSSVYTTFNDTDPYYYELNDAGSLEIARPVKYAGSSDDLLAREVVAVFAAYEKAVAELRAAKGAYEYLLQVQTEQEKAFATAKVNLRAELQEIALLQRILAKNCS
jgi:hypothetical protein